MTFFGEEGQQNERALTFEKSRDKRHIACPDVVPLTGLEPVRCCQRGIFTPHHVAMAARRALWSGLYLRPRCFLRRAPSSLYTFPKNFRASLGIVPQPGVPPNLTRFTRTVSRSGAQFLSPLCLPIPPQRQICFCNHIPFSSACQASDGIMACRPYVKKAP